MWFSWRFIQSTFVYSHPNFLIVFSSPKSLKLENVVCICWCWYSKVLKIHWLKIIQRCYVDGSGSQKSKMGLTRLKCLYLGISSGGSWGGWVSLPFPASRSLGCLSVFNHSQVFQTWHQSVLSATLPVSIYRRLLCLLKALVWIQYEMYPRVSGLEFGSQLMMLFWGFWKLWEMGSSWR